MKKSINKKYINLLVEMLRNHETKDDLCKVLGLSRSSIDKRFTGEVEWTIGDVENLCKHYEKDYYYLLFHEVK